METKPDDPSLAPPLPKLTPPDIPYMECPLPMETDPDKSEDSPDPIETMPEEAPEAPDPIIMAPEVSYRVLPVPSNNEPECWSFEAEVTVALPLV